jgi:chlorobactene glucosyltransferase
MLLFFLTVFILVVLSGILFITLFNAVFTPTVKTSHRLQSEASLVSILIPARNEEHNIKACLESLSTQTYQNCEIIVLNDQSSDQTGNIVAEIAKLNPIVRLVSGEDLPSGWLGKNWACHQLSRAARGDILIFADADITCSESAIANTVSWLQRYDLGMLSVFPQQLTSGWFEKLIVSTVYMFVYSYLPLWLTYYSNLPALSAANGQWLAFTQSCYRRIGGHERVRQFIAEDIRLARLVKSDRFKMITLAGNDTIFCKMYHSWTEVWHGFTKNGYELLSGHAASFFVLISLVILLHSGPYLLVMVEPLRVLALVAVVANVLIRMVVAIRFRQPFWHSILFHPIAVLGIVTIAINSFIKLKTAGIVWKERHIKYDDALRVKNRHGLTMLKGSS